MQQIFSNTTLTVNQLIEKIDTGELGLPELQRPFIWKDSKVRDLFDSMMCGYTRLLGNNKFHFVHPPSSKMGKNIAPGTCDPWRYVGRFE